MWLLFFTATPAPRWPTLRSFRRPRTSGIDRTPSTRPQGLDEYSVQEGTSWKLTRSKNVNETTEACKVRMGNSILASALLGEAGELHPLDNLAQPIMISSPASHCKANDTTRLLKPAS
ncbi:hypothetical protein E2C01_024742 [Portunus trituberculatus]|uniref:Uncharacterized protein n=1 Tax=Portunus trituberculatus TaxID=210409 RepID=A0A5B7EEK6_PORTR|nr:hypothetical protein [Portunus trituberculatus]